MNRAAGELVPGRMNGAAGELVPGRMNGAAGELVPGRMRETLGDRFNADAPLEEGKEQKIERAVIINDSPIIISKAQYLISLLKDNFIKD